MRDEVRRLAAENGRSMNAQIIELLAFAIKNSGLDIDEILQMVADQRKAMASLRRSPGENAVGAEGADDAHKQLEEYRQALQQKDGLLMALCLQLFMNRDSLPPESLVLADALLNSSGELDLLSLTDREERDVPEARYHAIVRRFLTANKASRQGDLTKDSVGAPKRVTR
jgi:hypothetical protein